MKDAKPRGGWKNLAAFSIGLLAAYLIAEIFLRIYNPFVVRIKGDRIILPANQKHVWKNVISPGLDDTVHHSTNSLGFRGPEKPADFGKALTFITVGGSTTECASLSDGDDWPAILHKLLLKHFPHAWVNNAGMGGHSTYGHLLLMEDHIAQLKPDYVLFLTGANEVNRPDLISLDSTILKSRQNRVGRIVNQSEVFSLIYNLWMGRDATYRIRDHGHDGVQLKDTISISGLEKRALQKSHVPFIEKYESRLLQLIRVSRKNGIEPIFCTQPILWGYTTDSVTGKYLGNISTHGLPSGLVWEIWEMYNDRLREVCKSHNVFLIDLAELMPKNSFYYYDDMHFNKPGAIKVAQIINRVIVAHREQLRINP